jgi:hypothetical protein
MLAWHRFTHHRVALFVRSNRHSIVLTLSGSATCTADGLHSVHSSDVKPQLGILLVFEAFGLCSWCNRKGANEMSGFVISATTDSVEGRMSPIDDFR